LNNQDDHASKTVLNVIRSQDCKLGAVLFYKKRWML